MSATPDISAILAALAARPSTTPSGTPQQQPPPQHQHPPQGLPPGFPGGMQNPTPPAGIPGFPLPQPSSSGSVDLSAIKPINTGSVSIQDALAKARGFAAEKGLSYDGGRSSTGSREDPRLGGRQFNSGHRSRSRSRSPPRRDNMRDSYNPYRDERRDDPRRGGVGYGRERSRSPQRRNTFSPPRNYGTRSPPANDNSEVILIDSSLVGLVIGRQGENLRRIEEVTATRIQFLTGPESSGPQRQCRITGNPRARMDAKREINRIIEENGGNPARETGRGGRAAAPTKAGHQPALREGENSVQIMVPDRTVGLIIGRGGETIRDLQEQSGCHVNIVGENKSVNGLRPVNLIGTPTAAAKAKELILEIVDSDTKPAGEAPQTNNRRDNFDPYGSNGANKISESIMVPSDAVGMIIGKGGETIKDMQATTGCKINVSQASGADIEREIGLVGTHEAIENAKKAIWDKVDSVKEKNGGGYGNNRRGGGRDNSNHNDQYSQQQQSFGQAPGGGQALPQAQPNTPQGDGAADPYAIYGGYQNYMAMWYASFAQQQQQQQQQGGGQGDQ